MRPTWRSAYFLCACPRSPPHAVTTPTTLQSRPSKRPFGTQTPLTAEERQVKMRLDIEADDLGFVLVSKDLYLAELKMATLPKLIARTMGNLSQSTTVTG